MHGLSDATEAVGMPPIPLDLVDGRLDADAAGAVAWRRRLAALVWDSRRQGRPAGMRAVGSDTPRLLYRAGGVEIDLEVGDSSIGGRLRMLGHVTTDEPGPVGAWVVLDGPAGRAGADIDRLGQFALDGLAGGRCRLQVGLGPGRALIEIPDLEL